MDPVTVGELSVAGGAIYVAIRTVEWSINAVRSRKNGSLTNTSDVLATQCRKKIEDIHSYTQTNKETMTAVRAGVSSGGFSCVWQGRDEVHEFFDAIKDNTRELKQLTGELRKANNGR